MQPIGKFKKALQKVNKYAGAIMVGLGITGFGYSIYKAVKVTPKAIELIEQRKKAEEKEKLTVGETIGTTWKLYLPSAIAAVTSTGCIIGGCVKQHKHNAALAAALAVSEARVESVTNAITKELGEEARAKVEKRVADDKIRQEETAPPIVVANQKNLFYDTELGGYFYSTIPEINEAANRVNKELREGYFICAAEFFYKLDRKDMPNSSKKLGFHIDKGYLEPRFEGGGITDDGRSFIYMMYKAHPKELCY